MVAEPQPSLQSVPRGVQPRGASVRRTSLLLLTAIGLMREYSPGGPRTLSLLRRSLRAALPGAHYVQRGSPDLKAGPRAAPPAMTAATRDGTRLAYTLHGSGRERRHRAHPFAGHGSRRSGSRSSASSPTELPVLSYDCRGHGQSDKPNGRTPPYTVELFRPRSCGSARSCRLELGHRRRRLHGRLCVARLRRGLSRAYAALGLIDTTAWYGAEAPQAVGRARRPRRQRMEWARWSSSRPPAGSGTGFAPSTPDIVE